MTTIKENYSSIMECFFGGDVEKGRAALDKCLRLEEEGWTAKRLNYRGSSGFSVVMDNLDMFMEISYYPGQGERTYYEDAYGFKSRKLKL